MTIAALPEIAELEALIELAGPRAEVRQLDEIQDARARYPLVSIQIGSRSPEAPAIGLFGGVHGLERIGTHVLLSYLADVLERLGRDETLERLLESVRLIFMPLVNPAGMVRATRANANGVDLMRNAPIESRERVTFLLGGQRITPILPWYRGAPGAPMEPESRALCDLVRTELLPRPFSLALDCHSGFGLTDRIWFPHAHTRDPFAHLAEVHALKQRFDAEHPEHAYLFEPQSRRYLTHGDLWDYLHAEAAADQRLFLPLTLEMGSWRWILERPRQLLSRAGIFNPLRRERAERVRRDHIRWLDFLCAAVHAWRDWLPSGDGRDHHERLGLAAWFGRAA
ncbi:MAG: zinc carboxypeptidase [Betaproteobacteria bacterium]|nr:zinc carboxypeptidase [Betaproteobacteria bacterium]